MLAISRCRRQRTTLWGSFVAGFDQPVLHYSRVEERANQPERTPIVNPFRQVRHEPVMIDPVEELFQVKVHDVAAPRRNYFLRPRHRLFR